jgi:hypothetical protein
LVVVVDEFHEFVSRKNFPQISQVAPIVILYEISAPFPKSAGNQFLKRKGT